MDMDESDNSPKARIDSKIISNRDATSANPAWAFEEMGFASNCFIMFAGFFRKMKGEFAGTYGIFCIYEVNAN